MTVNLTRRYAICLAAGGAVAALGPAHADDVLEARHIIDEALITVDRVRAEMRKGGELDSALARAKGVLIVPSYYKAGFVLGGAYGDGVLLSRLPEGGFSDPAFYRMTAGSIGLQFGMQSAAIIFAILTEKGLSAVINYYFMLGANVGVSIGTVGAGAEAATTTHVGRDIVAYSTNTGLFAGAGFEGAVIRPRKDWNAGVYGVGNDNPLAITQRNQLRIAAGLKDSLGKSVPPAEPAIN